MTRLMLAIGLALAPGPAPAQYIGNAPPPPLPAAPRPGEVETPAASLARAVRTLAQRPRDFPALIAAGRAEVDLGDTQAAIGFFGRAEEVRPSDPAPKIGMGAAAVATGDAGGALTWFAQAQQLGATSAAIGADRGLAQDLLGNQAAAQSDYRAAMAGPEADDARRRLALSLGISGDRGGAFAILQPLLQRGDPGAQRIRAFVLALVGDERGASSAIDSAMPGAGQRMAGFFRLLPQLSAIQKAAAVHLGIFPDPNQIRVAAAAVPVAPPTRREARASARADRARARSSSAIAPPVEIARTDPAAPSVAVAAATPTWRPARRVIVIDPVAPAATSTFDFRRPGARPRKVSQAPAPKVANVVSQPGFAVPLPQPTVAPPPAEPLIVEPVRNDPQSDVVEAAPVALPGEPTPAIAQPAPTTPIAQPAPTTPIAQPAPTTPPIVAVPGDRLSGIDRLLAQAEELPVPPAPRPRIESRVRPEAKAIDLKKVADAKKAADARKAADAKQAADARQAAANKAEREAIGVAGTNWVQLAGGAHADRMAIEFARLGAKSALLRKRGGAVTGGRDYFRLLTGPFDSKAAAQAFVNQLAKDGVAGFSWTRTPMTLRIEKLAPK